MGNKKNLNYLQKEEFNNFYSKVVEKVLDAQKNPGKTSLSLKQMMEESDFELNVNPVVMDLIQPNLSANLYASSSISNGCPMCSICAVCALCAEVNAAAGTVGVTGIFGLLNASVTKSA